MYVLKWIKTQENRTKSNKGNNHAKKLDKSLYLLKSKVQVISHVFDCDQIATQLRRNCDRTVMRNCEKLRRNCAQLWRKNRSCA